VASGPADTGNLPGNNGNELQGLALELRHTAQIDPGAKDTSISYFIFYFAAVACVLINNLLLKKKI
jgi:hypothetical protein